MVVEVIRDIVVVGGVRVASGPLLSDELFRGCRCVVIVFLVEVRERFTKILNLKIWSDSPEIEGMALDGADEAR